MKKTAALFPLVILCIAGSAFALGGKEKNGSKPQKVEVTGTVRMVGNSPMTSLVISGLSHDSGDSREWYIAPEEEVKLVKFQQQTVTVKAQEYYYDRTFANGSPAGRQYFLKNIIIISPKR